jgi:multimeric flavodoxin WrbA
MGTAMTIRIACFSRTGHTQKVADALAENLKNTGKEIEIVRIEPANAIKIATQAVKAFFSMKSPIRPCKTDLAGTDALVIATPVWAGKVPPYVNAYLSAVTGGEGKPFHVIAEMGGRGAEGAIAHVQKRLEKKGMKFISSAFTVESEVESGAFLSKVEAFAKGIGKGE